LRLPLEEGAVVKGDHVFAAMAIVTNTWKVEGLWRAIQV